jgi:hypothetical protein
MTAEDNPITQKAFDALSTKQGDSNYDVTRCFE